MLISRTCALMTPASAAAKTAASALPGLKAVVVSRPLCSRHNYLLLPLSPPPPPPPPFFFFFFPLCFLWAREEGERRKVTVRRPDRGASPPCAAAAAGPPVVIPWIGCLAAFLRACSVFRLQPVWLREFARMCKGRPYVWKDEFSSSVLCFP